MTKKILMLYAKECIDAMLMMPMLQTYNMTGKYHFESHDVWHDDAAKKLKATIQPLLDKNGKPNAIPAFIDLEKNEAIIAPNFEKLNAWLEGPEWYKAYM